MHIAQLRQLPLKRSFARVTGRVSGRPARLAVRYLSVISLCLLVGLPDTAIAAGAAKAILVDAAINDTGRAELDWIPTAAVAAVRWCVDAAGWEVADGGRRGASGREAARLTVRVAEAGGLPAILVRLVGTDVTTGAREGIFGLDGGVAAALEKVPAFIAAALPPSVRDKVRREAISRSDAALAAFAGAETDGDQERARAGYAEAVRLDPEFMLARWRLAMLLYRRGEPAAAADEFRLFAERHDDDYAALNNLGQALVRSGRAGEAIAPLRSALNLSGGDIDIRFNLARALTRARRLAEAESEYAALARAFPGDARMPLERALLRELEGDPVGALGSLPPATDEAAEHLTALGRSAWEDGDAQLAKAAFGLVCALDPRHHRARLSLGVIRYQEGDHAGAIRELEEALRLREDDPVSHRYLGLAYQTAGRAAEAEAHLKRAVGLEERPSRPANLSGHGGSGEKSPATGVVRPEPVQRGGQAEPQDKEVIRGLRERVERLEEELRRFRETDSRRLPAGSQ